MLIMLLLEQGQELKLKSGLFAVKVTYANYANIEKFEQGNKVGMKVKCRVGPGVGRQISSEFPTESFQQSNTLIPMVGVKLNLG